MKRDVKKKFNLFFNVLEYIHTFSASAENFDIVKTDKGILKIYCFGDKKLYLDDIFIGSYIHGVFDGSNNLRFII